jgi:hypothetical protein
LQLRFFYLQVELQLIFQLQVRLQLETMHSNY